jgi:hypothetical protein
LKKKSLLPKTFGHCGKILMLNILGILKIFILPDNFKHLIKVEKNLGAFWKIPNTQKQIRVV